VTSGEGCDSLSAAINEDCRGANQTQPLFEEQSAVVSIAYVIFFIAVITSVLAFIPCMVVGIVMLVNVKKSMNPEDYRGYATAAFVLGIIGIFTGGIVSILAIVFGALTKNKNFEDRSTRIHAKSGFILGIIGIALSEILLIIGAIVALSYSPEIIS
jgi:uncharacterized membrane protein